MTIKTKGMNVTNGVVMSGANTAKGFRYICLGFTRETDEKVLFTIQQTGQRSWDAFPISTVGTLTGHIHGNSRTIFKEVQKEINIYAIYAFNTEKEYRIGLIEALAFGTLQENTIEIIKG